MGRDTGAVWGTKPASAIRGMGGGVFCGGDEVVSASEVRRLVAANG